MHCEVHQLCVSHGFSNQSIKRKQKWWCVTYHISAYFQCFNFMQPWINALYDNHILMSVMASHSVQKEHPIKQHLCIWAVTLAHKFTRADIYNTDVNNQPCTGWAGVSRWADSGKSDRMSYNESLSCLIPLKIRLEQPHLTASLHLHQTPHKQEVH